ncbi:T9SS type A sorting domain-containing protein [Fibrella forsythiae]|uniref:T9SS type A sorting domain-containing protein n=1 Tax=Fibrella forsythiae TaxID=2817061 RepID=A0ABS3JH81_9BACT|nr:T9SS type A sorting domain-containing protein [Fibrella forsythiae]MBO0949365.1 T9SS type A sorting domain-containing protein [Fibrella forsythiae]
MSQRLQNSFSVWLVLLACFLPQWLVAQRIQLAEVPQTLCAGATLPISFTVNEPFDAGNTFRIEIINQFQQVVATATENVIPSGSFIQIPATLAPRPVEYTIQVVANKPLAVSNSVPLLFSGIPSATLRPLSASDGSLNPGEPLNVPVALTGGGPYSLSFTDGTTRDLDDVSLATLLLYPDQTKTYQLAAVTNRCGPGRGTGTATALVRSGGLLVTRLSTTEPCAGKPLDIFFSTDRPLPANTTFKVDLQPLTPQAAAYTLSAAGTTSPLRIQIPAGVAVGGAYQLRLYAEGANLSAYYRNALGDAISFILLRRSPSVSLSGDVSVGFGQAGQLKATVTGLGNGAITLSDGTVVPLSTLEQEGERLLPVQPTQTTTYTVRSVSTGCGIYGPEAGSGTARVTVQTGYRIDSLSSQSICAGQSVQVYFSTNEPLSTDAGSYGVRGGTSFTNNQLSGGLIDFVVQQVRAGSQPNTGVLTVTARSLPADYLTNGSYTPSSRLGAGWFYMQLSRAGQIGNVYEKRLAVADKPQLLLPDRPTPIAVLAPQVVSFAAQLASHTPYTDVVLSDGTRMSVRSEIGSGQKSSALLLEVLASQSGTFRVVSVQNSCGIGTAQGSVAIQIRNDTSGLFMRPIPDLLCAGSALSVAFSTLGNIGAVSGYRVEISDDDGLFRGKYLATGTSSPIAVTIPSGLSLYNRIQLRVVTSPTSGTLTRQSDARTFTYLDAAQLVRLSAAGSGGTELVIRSGETAQLRLLSGGNSVATPTRVVLSDGQVVSFNAIGTDVSVRPAQTTTYTIRSVQNSCGAAAGVGTVTVRVQPFYVQPLLQKQTYCDGDSLQVHLLLQGSLSAQATHSLQILQNGNAIQTLPARLTDNRLTASLPASLTVGAPYTVRVLTTIGNDQFYSLPTSATFQTYRPARLQLTPPGNQTAIVLEANQSSVTVQLTNPTDPSATVLLTRYNYRINEQPYRSIDNVPASVPLYATSTIPTSYSLSAVYDAYCGFGTVAGAVRISYRPGLRSLSINKTQFCRGSEQAIINYEVAGDFSADTRFTLFLINSAGVRIRVGESAKQVDRLIVPIDSALVSGTYQLSLTLPAGLPPYSSFPTITIGDRPTVVIAGGNSVQYSDQSVSIGIRVLTGFLPVSMTLTNGITQTLFDTENTLTFSPQQSTNYQITRVTNTCGAGRFSGVVSVTVLPSLANEIRVASVGPQGGVTGICQGGAIQVGLTTKGQFAADNRFTIYLSDSTGQNYRPLTTQTVNANTVSAALPPDALPGTGYRVRIGASNPELLGASSGTFLTIRPGLQAAISGSKNVFRGELTPVIFTINNTGPWSVSLNHSIYGFETLIINTSPFLYQVRPDATTTYTLLGVFNLQCGNGRVSGQVTFTVSDPLATDPALPVSVRVMPNPTAGQLRVEGTLPAPRSVIIRLTDATGRMLQTHSPGQTSNLRHDLDLGEYAAGIYLLTVEADDRRTIFKIVKQ